MNLYLVGPMGAGKSEVGRRLSERLGLPLADTDTLVETRAGMSVSEIFRILGEERFREMEAEAIRGLAASEGHVVACGGGAVLRPGNVDAMRSSGVVFYLAVGAETAAARVGDAAGRPLLQGAGSPRERLEEMIVGREPLYRGAAHHVVETEGRGPQEVAEEVERVWKGYS